jgi:transcriptional pleiotropic regulator of transition state genes
MKSTGVTRPVDELGRFVIPIEIRRTMEIEEGQPMSIFIDGDRIILKQYKPGCVFCDALEYDMIRLKGKSVCRRCCKAMVKGEV